MNKLRESIYVILSVIILSIAVIMFVRPNDKVDKENDNSNQYNKESENSVDEETIKEILDESTNKNVIDKVNSYIKSGKYYYVQEDVKYNERIYKVVQIYNLEYPSRAYPDFEYNHKEHDLCYIYYSNDEKLKNKFDKQLEEEYILEYETKEYEQCVESFEYGIPSIVAPCAGDKEIFYRNSNFGYMNESTITALLCDSKDGSTEVVNAFQGATGLNISVNEKDELVWDVYIANQFDYYWYGCRYPDREDIIIGKTFSAGDVYSICINNKNQVCAINLMYKSENNDLEDISAYSERETDEKLYVKNSDLSILDFVNYNKLESVMKDSYLQTQKEYNKIRDIFGLETIHYAGDTTQAMYYLTKEGYMVIFAPYFTSGTNEKRVSVSYLKLTPEEFAKMDYNQKNKFIRENKRELFVNEKINPELMDELERK